MEGWERQHLFLGKSFSSQQPGEGACYNTEGRGNWTCSTFKRSFYNHSICAPSCMNQGGEAAHADRAVAVSCLELLFGVLLLHLVKVLYQTVTCAPSGSHSNPVPWSNNLILS